MFVYRPTLVVCEYRINQQCITLWVRLLVIQGARVEIEAIAVLGEIVDAPAFTDMASQTEKE